LRCAVLCSSGDHLCSSKGEEPEKAEAEGEQPSLYVFKDFNWCAPLLPRCDCLAF
jgi:hypothetical protein